MKLKQYLLPVIAIAAFAFASPGSAQETAPDSVIHVVTVSWKDDATPEQIQAALDGVKTLAEDYEGIVRVWTKTLRAQGNRSHAFVMEFKDEQAWKDYANSEAQKKWYEVYLPVRAGSTTFGVSN